MTSELKSGIETRTLSSQPEIKLTPEVIDELVEKANKGELLASFKNSIDRGFNVIKKKDISLWTAQEVKIAELHLYISHNVKDGKLDAQLSAVESETLKRIESVPVFEDIHMRIENSPIENLSLLGISPSTSMNLAPLAAMKTPADVERHITPDSLHALYKVTIPPEKIDFVHKNTVHFMKKYLTHFENFQSPLFPKTDLKKLSLKNMHANLTFSEGVYKRVDYINQHKSEFEKGNFSIMNMNDMAVKAFDAFAQMNYIDFGKKTRKPDFLQKVQQRDVNSPMMNFLYKNKNNPTLKDYYELASAEQLKKYSKKITTGALKGQYLLNDEYVAKESKGAFGMKDVKVIKNIQGSSALENLTNFTLMYKDLESKGLQNSSPVVLKDYQTEFAKLNGALAKKNKETEELLRGRIERAKDPKYKHPAMEAMEEIQRRQGGGTVEGPGFTFVDRGNNSLINGLNIKSAQETADRNIKACFEMDQLQAKSLLRTGKVDGVVHGNLTQCTMDFGRAKGNANYPRYNVLREKYIAGKITEIEKKEMIAKESEIMKDVVRDDFGENFVDGWNQFIEDSKNNPERAFGTFTGMVGGVLSTAGVVALSQGTILSNPLVTAAAFTAGNRLGGGLGRAGFRLVASGGDLGQTGESFLKGIGVHNEKGQYIGGAELAEGLAKEYVSSVLIFKLGGLPSAMTNLVTAENTFMHSALNMTQMKALPHGMKHAVEGMIHFGMEELIVEPIVETAVEAGAVGGKVAFGKEHVEAHIGGHKKFMLATHAHVDDADAFSAMINVFTTQFAPENLGNLYAGTIFYGGILNAGQSGMSRVKASMGNSASLLNYSALSKKALTMITASMILAQSMGVTIDTKTGTAVDRSGKPIDGNKIEYVQLNAKLKELAPVMADTIVAAQQVRNEVLALTENDPNGLFANKLAMDKKYPGLVNDSLPIVQSIDVFRSRLQADVKNAKTPAMRLAADDRLKIFNEDVKIYSQTGNTQTVAVERNIQQERVVENKGETKVVEQIADSVNKPILEKVSQVTTVLDSMKGIETNDASYITLKTTLSTLMNTIKNVPQTVGNTLSSLNNAVSSYLDMTMQVLKDAKRLPAELSRPIIDRLNKFGVYLNTGFQNAADLNNDILTDLNKRFSSKPAMSVGDTMPTVLENNVNDESSSAELEGVKKFAELNDTILDSLMKLNTLIEEKFQLEQSEIPGIESDIRKLKDEQKNLISKGLPEAEYKKQFDELQSRIEKFQIDAKNLYETLIKIRNQITKIDKDSLELEELLPDLDGTGNKIAENREIDTHLFNSEMVNFDMVGMLAEHLHVPKNKQLYDMLQDAGYFQLQKELAGKGVDIKNLPAFVGRDGKIYLNKNSDFLKDKFETVQEGGKRKRIIDMNKHPEVQRYIDQIKAHEKAIGILDVFGIKSIDIQGRQFTQSTLANIMERYFLDGTIGKEITIFDEQGNKIQLTQSDIESLQKELQSRILPKMSISIEIGSKNKVFTENEIIQLYDYILNPDKEVPRNLTIRQADGNESGVDIVITKKELDALRSQMNNKTFQSLERAKLYFDMSGEKSIQFSDRVQTAISKSFDLKQLKNLYGTLEQTRPELMRKSKATARNYEDTQRNSLVVGTEVEAKTSETVSREESKPIEKYSEKSQFTKEEVDANAGIVDNVGGPALQQPRIKKLVEQWKEKNGEEIVLSEKEAEGLMAMHAVPGEVGKLTRKQIEARIAEGMKAFSDRDGKMPKKMIRFAMEGGYAGFFSSILESVMPKSKSETVIEAEPAKNYSLETELGDIGWLDLYTELENKHGFKRGGSMPLNLSQPILIIAKNFPKVTIKTVIENKGLLETLDVNMITPFVEKMKLESPNFLSETKDLKILETLKPATIEIVQERLKEFEMLMQKLDKLHSTFADQVKKSPINRDKLSELLQEMKSTYKDPIYLKEGVKNSGKPLNQKTQDEILMDSVDLIWHDVGQPIARTNRLGYPHMSELLENGTNEQILEYSKNKDFTAPLFSLDLYDARTEASKGEQGNSTFESHIIIDKIMNKLTSDFGEGKYNIITDTNNQLKDGMNIIVDNQLKDNIRTNLGAVYGLLRNAINNSVEFIDNPKKVIKIGLKINDKNQIVIELEDNGIGIPKDKIDGVLGKGERVTQTTDAYGNQRTSNGIGISGSVNNIEQAKGTVEIESYTKNNKAPVGRLFNNNETGTITRIVLPNLSTK